ncbi:MAG: metallophosphoesterase, partial [Clostridia bacterium]|nr:metallophosphoesterase [Clostridia bacterium]
MKRLLSIVLAIALLMSSLVILTNAAMDENDNWIPDNDKWSSVSRDGVVARLAIGSDIHYPAYNSEGKIQYIYSALKQIGGVDAFLISGDVTNNGEKEQYTSLMAQVNKYTKKSAVNPNATGDSVGMTILALGNHDYGDDSADGEARFEKYTGQATDALHWVRGIPVISLSPDYKEGSFAGDRYDLSYDVLKSAYDEIDAKGYKGLIIAMAHHRPSQDGSPTTAWSSDMMALMKAHPNTVIFTGDYHTWMKPTNDFIFQDAGFTHVRGGSLGKDYRPADESAFINPTTGQ